MVQQRLSPTLHDFNYAIILVMFVVHQFGPKCRYKWWNLSLALLSSSMVMWRTLTRKNPLLLRFKDSVISIVGFSSYIIFIKIYGLLEWSLIQCFVAILAWKHINIDDTCKSFIALVSAIITPLLYNLLNNPHERVRRCFWNHFSNDQTTVNS